MLMQRLVQSAARQHSVTTPPRRSRAPRANTHDCSVTSRLSTKYNTPQSSRMLLQGNESRWRLSDAGRIPAEGELRKLATPDAWCAGVCRVLGLGASADS